MISLFKRLSFTLLVVAFLSLSFLVKSEANIVDRAIGTAASSVAASAGYAVDGLIYAVGGTGVFLVNCVPYIATGYIASVGSDGKPNFPFCADNKVISYKNLHRNHPHFGNKIWRNTADMRE